MAPAPLPDPVRRLIVDHIDSVSQLDVLMLLRSTPDRAWTPDEVARALVSRATAASGFLERLVGAQLVERDAAGYRYGPGPRCEPVVDELAECYRTRRQTVTGLILGGGDDPVSSLADAFRFRRRSP